MQFRDIIGQEELKRRLVASVAAGRVSHAQLFTGAAGAGTLPLAVAYAQYLNCRHRADGDSCGVCPDCRQIAALAHPDLHLVFPVNKQGKKSGEVITSDAFLPLFRTVFARSNGYFSPQEWYDALDLGKTLRGANSAREADEIIRKLSFKSFEAEYKVMLVWLPETMNEEAANKILKILEEPWEKTVFLLVSEAPDRLLQTILSRTQEVAVPRISTEVLEAVAARHGQSDPARLHNLARLAGGDYLTLQRLLAGEDDELTRDCFGLFCSLMRLSYNATNTSNWCRGPRRWRISRANSSGRSCATRRVCCARATCSTPDWPTSATCGAPKPIFAGSSPPLSATRTWSSCSTRSNGRCVRSRRTAIRRSSLRTSR